MRIGVEGDRDACVTQSLADDLGVDPGLQGEGGMRIARFAVGIVENLNKIGGASPGGWDTESGRLELQVEEFAEFYKDLSPYKRLAFHEGILALGDCADGLERVGPAPAPDLEPFVEMLEEMCSTFESANWDFSLYILDDAALSGSPAGADARKGFVSARERISTGAETFNSTPRLVPDRVLPLNDREVILP
jgi:hypothetical protein